MKNRRQIKYEHKKMNLEQITFILDSACRNCTIRQSNPKRFSQKLLNEHCNSHCEAGKELHKLSDTNFNNSIEMRIGEWSYEEELYLINHYMYFSISHLAEKLNRSEDSIKEKLTKMLSGKRKNDLIASEIAQ